MILAGPGLPLAAPSTLNFHNLSGKEDQRTTSFSLKGPQPKQASQSYRMSFNLILMHSFLTKARLAIHRFTTDIRFSFNDATSPQDPIILFTLEVQIYQRIAKGINLQSKSPHPLNDPCAQDRANSQWPLENSKLGRTY